MTGVEDAQASQKRAKGRPEEDNDKQNTSRDGAEQERVKMKQYVGSQEARTGDMTPIRTRRDQARGRDRRAGGGWFKNCRSNDVTKKGEPIGVVRGARDVEGSERGATGWGITRHKRARGAGMQGTTCTLVAGQGRQDSE